jgi:NAD(P)-dependent dehydrogenase (short-subunit alcohol dehydrogenase family)
MADRIALVTGASRGIGKATAVALAQTGFDVAVTARTVHEGEGVDDSDERRRRLPGSLDTTAAAVEAAGRRAFPVPMDLHDGASLVAAVERVLEEWGHIDVLVNNAVDTGPGSMTRFLDTPLDAFAAKLDANALAQVALIKLVLPGMLARGGGTIVNVTSAVAVIDPSAPTGQGGWGAAYAMSKGAFHRLAAILAVELAGEAVFVFNVEPGFVVTEKMEMNQQDLGLEGRYPGAPPSVPAAVIAWLATDPGAAALNGQTISAQRFARERALHADWRR